MWVAKCFFCFGRYKKNIGDMRAGWSCKVCGVREQRIELFEMVLAFVFSISFLLASSPVLVLRLEDCKVVLHDEGAL